MKPAYIVTNLLESATLTASTEDTVVDYQLPSLVDRIGAKPFRFTVTTGGWIEADLGSAKAFDTLGIVFHNFAPAVTGNVKAGASPNPSTTVGTLVYRAGTLWIDLGAQSARYMRLTVTDANSANTQIGELILGTRIELPVSWRYVGPTEGKARTDVSAETYGGVPYFFRLFEREVLEQTFRLTRTGGNLDAFRTLDEATDGALNPFFYLPDPDEARAFYVRKEPDWIPSEIGEPADLIAFDYTMRLKQESPGLDITA